MDLILSLSKKHTSLGYLIMAMMLVFVNGCGGDADSVVVDFSKTISVDRPEAKPSRHLPRVIFLPFRDLVSGKLFIKISNPLIKKAFML